jgi:hypothetical protein
VSFTCVVLPHFPHRHKCEAFVLDASSSFSGSLQAEQRYLASRKPGAKPMKKRSFLLLALCKYMQRNIVITFLSIEYVISQAPNSSIKTPLLFFLSIATGPRSAD